MISVLLGPLLVSPFIAAAALQKNGMLSLAEISFVG
jgi:hypothetical protein